MTLIPGLTWRRVSRIMRVESTLMRSPRSRLASAAPLISPWSRYTCVRSGVKSFSQVAWSVRSALIERISAVKFASGDWTSGSTMSVSIKLEIEESESSAVVRAWPIKPLAPVMRMFIFLDFFMALDSMT